MLSVVHSEEVPMFFVVPTVHTKGDGQTYYTYKFKSYREFVGTSQPAKRMLANLCGSLTEDAAIVKVVGFDQYGKPLAEDFWIEALQVAVHSFPWKVTVLWSQSGVKEGTFILVRQQEFAKLGRRFDLAKDGYIFGAYIGLLFSDLANLPYVEAPAVWWDAEIDGKDGNGFISRALAIARWGDDRARQVRIVVIDEDGSPKLLGKGVLEPVSWLDGDINPVRLNDSMIKWHSGITHTDTVLIAPTPVVDRTIKTGITWEVLSFLKPCQEVLETVRDLASKAAYELCSLMANEDRVPLLKRLGQLSINRQGQLVEADRNILSLVRSGVPWCAEMEDRLGRFSVREIVEKIAPSGGIYGYARMALQDVRAPKPCAWTDDVKAIAFRLPSTSVDNVVPFAVRLRNGRVHPSAMILMAGDSDGDFIVIITDPKIIALFVKHRLNFHAGFKPDKRRLDAPVSSEFQFENAIKVHRDGSLIGRLTMVAHYFFARGQYDLAAKVGNMAQALPMLAKYAGMLVDGKPLLDAIKPFLSISLMLEIAEGVRVSVFPWRNMQSESRQCSSPRELGTFHIDGPVSDNVPLSIIDHAFNFTFEGVAKWSNENPLKDLRLPAASSLAFRVHDVSELRITQADVSWRKKLVSLWGRYWSANHGKRAKHGEWLDVMRQIGQHATLAQLMCLLRWSPMSGRSSGFLLKYHVIGTRWEELLGYHPSVETWLDEATEGLAFKTLSSAVMSAVIESELEGWRDDKGVYVFPDEIL